MYTKNITSKIAILRRARGVIEAQTAKIDDVVRMVNAVWTETNEPYPLPVGEYKRRAWLMADVIRMENDLEAELLAAIDKQRANGFPVDEEGNDVREWSGESIEEDHRLALFMNRVIESGQGYECLVHSNREFCKAARVVWLKRRKPVRDAACAYKGAFSAFLNISDMDTFTEVCRAWLAMMDEAIAYDQTHNAMREIKEGFGYADDNICLAFRAFWFKGEHTDLMTANAAWCRMRDEASKMNLGIDQAEKIITAMDGQPGAKEAASGCLMRDDHNEIDFMVEVAARRSVLAQPCAAARNNAHYYELLVAKRQRKGYVAMTQINLAYQYILNDAIAGDMVKSCDVYRMEIIFRDGSWLGLVETMTTDVLPHGFYVKTQDKLA